MAKQPPKSQQKLEQVLANVEAPKINVEKAVNKGIAAAQAAQRPRREVMDDGRAPLDHNKAREREVGGMTFRRTREGFDSSSKMRLDIPKEVLNPELNYRFVNDDGSAVQRRTEMGYAIVDKASLANGSIETTRRVGTKADGSPLNAVLMATPKDWYDERHQSAEKERLQKERGIFKQDSEGTLGKEFYDKGSEIKN
jgi:hypothetical protein